MNILLLLLAAIIFAGCQHNVESEGVAEVHEFTQNTRVVDVITCKSFDGFGRLIFPTRGILHEGKSRRRLENFLRHLHGGGKTFKPSQERHGIIFLS